MGILDRWPHLQELEEAYGPPRMIVHRRDVVLVALRLSSFGRDPNYPNFFFNFYFSVSSFDPDKTKICYSTCIYIYTLCIFT
jgi:hypothetical protein